MKDTSRGQLAETLEIISNHLAAVEHYFDLPFLYPQDLQEIASLREDRMILLKTFAKNGQIDIKYHCIVKHLLLSVRQTKELIESKLSNISSNPEENLKQISELTHILTSTKKHLGYALGKYLLVDVEMVENSDCISCIEDYLNGKKPLNEKL